MSKIGYCCVKSDISVKKLDDSVPNCTFLYGGAYLSLGYGENAARNFSQLIVFFNCFLTIVKRVCLS